MADDDKPAGGDKPAGDKAGEKKGEEQQKPATIQLTQEQFNQLLGKQFGEGAGKAEKATKDLLTQLGFDDELVNGLSFKDGESVAKFLAAAKQKKGSGAGDEKGAAADTEARVKAAVEEAQKAAQRQLKEREQETTKLKAIAEKGLVDGALIAAAAQAGAINPEQVAALTRGAVRLNMDTGVVEVLGDGGVARYADGGKLLTPGQYVAEWLAANPHMVRAELRQGAGQGNAGGGAGGSKTLTRADFEKLGPSERVEKMKAGFRITD